MTFADWVRNARQHIADSGWRVGGKAAASEFYTGAALRAFERLPGVMRTNVLDEEWDVLIVLDACRHDAFEEVAGEYGWLPEEIGSIRSTGSMSEEWMQETFTDEYRDELRNTGHVTWNAYSHYNLGEYSWAYLDEVWKHEWDNSRGLLPPETMTEQAVSRWRSDEADRMIVHYMQPHTPYRRLVDDGRVEALSHERVGEREDQGRLTVWKLLRRGEISHSEAWEAYLDNLRWVLDEIGRLRENLDAEKVVITADHGDCFGEWGLYGHPSGVPAPELVRVPWVEIETHDSQSIAGSTVDDADAESGTARDRLEALGYV